MFIIFLRCPLHLQGISVREVDAIGHSCEVLDEDKFARCTKRQRENVRVLSEQLLVVCMGSQFRIPKEVIDMCRIVGSLVLLEDEGH